MDGVDLNALIAALLALIGSGSSLNYDPNAA